MAIAHQQSTSVRTLAFSPLAEHDQPNSFCSTFFHCFAWTPSFPCPYFSYPMPTWFLRISLLWKCFHQTFNWKVEFLFQMELFNVSIIDGVPSTLLQHLFNDSRSINALRMSEPGDKILCNRYTCCSMFLQYEEIAEIWTLNGLYSIHYCPCF